MTITQIARMPEQWVEEGRQAGAHLDQSLASPWVYFAAFHGSEWCGMIGLLLVGQFRAHIRGWYVREDWRGQQIGAALLSAAIRHARALGLEVLDMRTAHNVAWAGFEETGYQRTKGNQEKQWILHL